MYVFIQLEEQIGTEKWKWNHGAHYDLVMVVNEFNPIILNK